MSYSTVKSGVLTQLRAVANFATANVSFADWRILNAGPARAMVVLFDHFENQEDAYGRMEIVWTFQIHLLEKAVPDPVAIEDRFSTDLIAILARVNSYPELGDVVWKARIARGEDTLELMEFGSAKYCHWGLTLEATEQVSAAYAE